MTSSRRTFLVRTLKGLGGLSLLNACGSSSQLVVDSSGDTGGSDSSGFAIGSGAFLSGKDYGNPFTGGASGCSAYGGSTEGPCHSNTYERKDISDGLVGLPTRFEFLVVDTACAPVANAIVEIWYASPAGTYSKAAESDTSSTYHGSLSDLNVGFCTGNDSVAVASKWLRGWQTTDADGRVTIDGVFPGWYSSRTPHVHFIVTVNGQQKVTSQMLFDESLTTQIYTTHTSYSSRGDKDTTNAKDNIVTGGLSLAAALTSYAKQSDGALLVWKQIAISA